MKTERTVRARKLQICRERLIGEKKDRLKNPKGRRIDKEGRERSGQAQLRTPSPPLPHPSPPSSPATLKGAHGDFSYVFGMSIVNRKYLICLKERQLSICSKQK